MTGLEYELYLQKRLAEAGLAFWTEGELRTMGFHKTPDCKLKVPREAGLCVYVYVLNQQLNMCVGHAHACPPLYCYAPLPLLSPAPQVPVAVRGRTGSEHLVCWVDSKATFGDSRTHVKQVEEQYRTYVNRCVVGAERCVNNGCGGQGPGSHAVDGRTLTGAYEHGGEAAGRQCAVHPLYRAGSHLSLAPPLFSRPVFWKVTLPPPQQ